MLGGPDDGQPSVRPVGPACGGFQFSVFNILSINFEGDTGLLDLPEDCLGLVLDLLDPVTVAILERVSRSLHTMIQVHLFSQGSNSYNG